PPFGYDLVLDHGTEAHLVADLVAERGVPVLIGPLFTSRAKVELRNRSLANPGKLAKAGVEISIITDHPVTPINFLIHQATLAVKEGLDRETALRAVTINPAKVLGIADQVGSLAPGKLADVAIWSGDPLDVMQRAQRVFIAGGEVYAHSAWGTGQAEGWAGREISLRMQCSAFAGLSFRQPWACHFFSCPGSARSNAHPRRTRVSGGMRASPRSRRSRNQKVVNLGRAMTIASASTCSACSSRTISAANIPSATTIGLPSAMNRRLPVRVEVGMS